MHKKSIAGLLGGLALVTILPVGSVSAQAVTSAQAYPAKAIKIIVPFATGGIADLFSRVIGKHLSLTWGQPVVVENRTGAGGNIGASMVAHADPDGYTLVMGNNGTQAINASLIANMPYDSRKDFTAIARVIEAEGLLVVHPSVPAHSVADIIRLAHKEPGTLNYASGGIGTTSHLAGELFKSMAKVDITHVPYKGNLEAINDLVGGRTSMVFATMPTVLPFVKEGRLRQIAVIEKQRSKAVPELPTVAETVPGFDVKNWIGLFGPAGMPPAIVEKINTEVMRIMSLPEVEQKYLASAGARFTPSTPAEFTEYVENERRIWSRIIKDAGIRVQ